MIAIAQARSAKARRALSRVAYRGLLCLTMISDALPSNIRFGHWQKVLSLLQPRTPLPVVPRTTAPPLPIPPRGGTAQTKGEACRCMLIAGALDGGGVEAVIAALALGLPAEGFDVEVVATQAGRVSADLSRVGVKVTTSSVAGLADLISERRPDVVELHRPDPEFLAAVLNSAPPVVPVFHAMESYLNAEAWTALERVVSQAPVCVAVSEGVREFFLQRIGPANISVVVNGVSKRDPRRILENGVARELVARALSDNIDDSDILVVALQRYSDQKNAAGLVDAFLKAAETEPRLRLVLAGSPDNWLEYRRADFLRRGAVLGHRVHLLGDSDSEVILTAGDLYALDSFAEGGPLTAVEAVLHGLPVVLSDVGFAAELVAQDGLVGEVVARANRDFSERELAAQRRRIHQSNREAFAKAMLRMADHGRSAADKVPTSFTMDSMVAGHAALLRSAISR